MTRKRRFIVLALVVLAPVGFAVRTAMKVTAESPQRAVMVEAEGLLGDYHREHGRYPDSLEKLPFKFGGDGDASTLALLEYRTDGAYYRIVTKSDWDGAEMSVCH